MREKSFKKAAFAPYKKMDCYASFFCKVDAKATNTSRSYLGCAQTHIS